MKPAIIAGDMTHRTTRNATMKTPGGVARMQREAEAQTKTARRDGEPSEGVVARGRIELPTRGFSIRCSTN